MVWGPLKKRLCERLFFPGFKGFYAVEGGVYLEVFLWGGGLKAPNFFGARGLRKGKSSPGKRSTNKREGDQRVERREIIGRNNNRGGRIKEREDQRVLTREHLGRE